MGGTMAGLKTPRALRAPFHTHRRNILNRKNSQKALGEAQQHINNGVTLTRSRLLPLYLRFRVLVRLDTCPGRRTMKKRQNSQQMNKKEEKEKDGNFMAFQVACHGCQPGQSLAWRFGRKGLGLG